MRAVTRLAWLQARWAPGHLLGAFAGLTVATAALLVLLALGEGLERAGNDWLGANVDTTSFDVVPVQASLGAIDLLGGGALAATPLDEATLADVAALRGVRHASAVLDLSLPLMAEGGEALLGRPLRADLLMTGIDGDTVADPAVQAAFVAPKSDAVAVLVHPGLLATYNATVAPSLKLPQLRAEALTGVRFTVYVGSSHLPGRSPVRQRGSFVAEVVGTDAAAQPLGLSMPAAAARQLWASYAEANAPLLVAKVRLQACGPEDVERLKRRLSKMGLNVDDRAAQLRGAVAVLGRVLRGLGAALAALAGGYGLQALRAHRLAEAPTLALLTVLGQPPRRLRLALGLQGLWVGVLAATAGGAAAAATAAALQRLLQQSAAGWSLQLPPLFVFVPQSVLLTSLGLAVSAALGAALAATPRQNRP